LVLQLPFSAADVANVDQDAVARLVVGVRRTCPNMRASEPFDGHCEHVADTSFRLDDTRCAGIDLQPAPQLQELHIDAAVEDSGE
jgi:hypothetical protein